MKRFLNWLASKAPAYRELQRREQREREILHHYAATLREIVNTVDGVKVPNGTTRRLGRLANDAFATVAAL